MPQGQGPRWVVVPNSAPGKTKTLRLDRSLLRRSTRAVVTLRRDHQEALGSVDLDPNRWLDAVTLTLDALKPVVHEQGDAPVSLFEHDSHHSVAACRRAAKLLSQEPRLAPLLSALSWVLSTRTAEAPRYLDWVAQNRLPLVTLLRSHSDGLSFAIQLAHLAQHVGAARLVELMALIGDLRLYTVPIDGAEAFIERTSSALGERSADGTLGLSMPEPELASALQRFTEHLLAQNPAFQRRALRLLGCCQLNTVLLEWSRWWSTARRVVDLANRSARARQGNRARRQAMNVTLTRLRALRQGIPLPRQQVGWSPTEFAPAMAVNFASLDHECVQEACAALGELSEHDPSIRWHFLYRWYRMSYVLRPRERARLLSAIRGFRHFVRATGGQPVVFKPWVCGPSTDYAWRPWWDTADSQVVDESRDPARVEALFESMIRVYRKRPDALTHTLTDRLAELVLANADARFAARAVLVLEETGHIGKDLTATQIQTALGLCNRDPRTFVELALAIRAICHDTDLRPEVVVSGFAHLVGADAELVRLLLLCPKRKLLLESARRLGALSSLKSQAQPIPLLPVAPDTVDAFPEALRTEGALLARFDADAVRVSRNLWGSASRASDAFREEQAKLTELLPRAPGWRAERLRKRLSNIEKRLLAEDGSSPTTARRLKRKLRQRAALKLLELVDAETHRAFRSATVRHFGLATEASWLSDPSVARVVTATFSLDRSTQRLAQRLLRERAGPPPWDLRDDPANRAFLDRLQRQGFHVAPWIDGIGTMELRTADGRAVALQLEDDPLQIFNMGTHFDTCLSPDDYNFFSVFSNAADINKRVLYSRDASAKVVGRRLLALSDEGRIVTYRPYSHVKGDDFDALSLGFIRELASAMGTIVVSEGHISRLAAPRWYDDGSFNVTYDFDCLSEGSDFRRSLTACRVERVPTLLEDAFGLAPLNEAQTHAVLQLPEIAARPELISSVLARADNAAALPKETAIRTALLLENAGHTDTAVRWFADPLERQMLSMHRDTQWLDERAVLFLCRRVPARGLRLLRSTAPRRNSHWGEAATTWRALAEATCMVALGRRNKAARLYEKAHDAHGASELERFAEERGIVLAR